MNERNDETTNDETGIETSDNQLTIRRIFDAPRERVWRAFTDADELEQWFVPDGMTAEVHANELEPGGAMSITWTDGENRIENEGYYVEVDEPKRLVSGEETEDGELSVIYEFNDVDDGTEVVITQEFPGSVPDGAAEGWAGMLDTLQEVLASVTEIESGRTTLTVEPDTRAIEAVRAFDAPREQVFAAYVDPDRIPDWWGPSRYETTVDEMDARPGGQWRFVSRDDDGNEFGFRGVYHDVVAPERLVQTWEFEGAPGQVALETATFEDVDGRTRMTVQTLFQTVAARDANAEPHMREGARETWDRLAALVENSETGKTEEA